VCVRAVHVHLLSPPSVGEQGGEGGGGKGRTHKIGVVRRQFIVQLDGVRLVDGVPQCLPASDNRVDAFRVGSPGKDDGGSWSL
jgi:hypothetical protein